MDEAPRGVGNNPLKKNLDLTFPFSKFSDTTTTITKHPDRPLLVRNQKLKENQETLLVNQKSKNSKHVNILESTVSNFLFTFQLGLTNRYPNEIGPRSKNSAMANV